ncbi:MAG: NADH:ubiquinone reductase (Na(+)-transporting) subunit C [Bacteroidetes bacterium]|nr:MAG: NADH:ubiquinone reductase (Na(+)-transporting) subunit C [Bacteroidota bacterium]
MQQSNTYIIVFSIITTIILGGLLSIAAVGLADTQQIAIDKDKKTQILGSVMKIDKQTDVLATYSKRIKSYVVDANGDKKEGMEAEKLDVGKEYKKEKSARLFPVFEFVSEQNPNEIEAYILPVYGAGLWDKIWGYVALEKDLNNVKGVVFAHKGETPGLGARISDAEIQDRYKGKKMFDNGGKLMGIEMLKSEKGNKLSENQVDGMSGATLTAKGVNAMIKNYLEYYQPYFDKNVRKKAEVAEIPVPAANTDSTAKTNADSVKTEAKAEDGKKKMKIGM